jgi:Fatty acid hydroxylase superfamily
MCAIAQTLARAHARLSVQPEKPMPLFRIEHSPWAYRADFILYGSACVALAAALLLAAPRAQAPGLAALAVAGLAGWSLIEYLLHRFVLHGLRPFSHWHAEHHRRPGALICTPTLLSASLIILLVFVPSLLLSDWWLASALTFGLLSGYLIYAVTHHALHHGPHHDSHHDSRQAGMSGSTRNTWLQRRRHWHALHHGSIHHLQRRPGHYGVTTTFWDQLLGSGTKRRSTSTGTSTR